MLVIGGTFEIDPAQREAFTAAAIDVMAATRAEDGCETYVLSADLEDPSRIHLFERWTSQEALSKHLQSAHIANFRAAAAGIFVSSSVLKCVIASEGPI